MAEASEETTATPWTCAGCGAPSKERERVCDCRTNVVGRDGRTAWKTARPLQKTYSKTHPYVIVRTDGEFNEGDEGEDIIGYEIWDERPESYHRLCTVYEDPGEDRGEAKRDAELIVRALNLMNGGLPS